MHQLKRFKILEDSGSKIDNTQILMNMAVTIALLLFEFLNFNLL